MALFAIVEFLLANKESNEVEIVPLSWLNEERNRCYWPPDKSLVTVRVKVKKLTPPQQHWTSYDAKCKKVFANYVDARAELPEAERRSDYGETEEEVNDQGEKKRRKRRPAHFGIDSCNSDEDADDLLPPAPKVGKLAGHLPDLRGELGLNSQEPFQPKPQEFHNPMPQVSHSPMLQASHSPMSQASHSPMPQASHNPMPQASHSPMPQESHSVFTRPSAMYSPRSPAMYSPRSPAMYSLRPSVTYSPKPPVSYSQRPSTPYSQWSQEEFGQGLQEPHSQRIHVSQSRSTCMPSPSTVSSEMGFSHREVEEPSGMRPYSGHNSNCCPCSKTMASLMLAMQKELSQHTRILNSLLLNTNKEILVRSTLENLPVPLPLRQLHDVEGFETHLREDSSFNACVLYFATLGGSTVKDIVKNMMQHLMADDVSAKHNMKGRGSKKSFEEYPRILNMIYRATIKHSNFSAATVSDIKEVVKDWLKHSKDRLKTHRNQGSQENMT